MNSTDIVHSLTVLHLLAPCVAYSDIDFGVGTQVALFFMDFLEAIFCLDLSGLIRLELRSSSVKDNDKEKAAAKEGLKESATNSFKVNTWMSLGVGR